MSKVTTILITGFPHCGTSILRAKLGEANDTFDQEQEHRYTETSPPGTKFHIWKHPLVHPEFKNDLGWGNKKNIPFFKDTHIIPIIRNPYYAFSSLVTKRYLNPFKTQDHTFNDYIFTAEKWLQAKKENIDKVYPIKYEELFENNNQKLWDTVNKIGLEFPFDSFKDRTKTYKMNGKELRLDKSIDEFEGAEYRIWQMNQEFKNMNTPEKFDIPERLEKLLDESDIVKELGYKNPRWEI